MGIPSLISSYFIVVKMQASVVRSAVSLDSPRGEGGEGGVAAGEGVEEWSLEVQRLRRRNVLLEKARAMMEEELQLFREEVQSKNRKIEQLSHQLARNNHSTPSSRRLPDVYTPPSASVILLEKEEQLSLAGQALRSQSQLLSQLQQQNSHLRTQLSSNASTIRQLKDSFRAQLSYQQAQVDALEQRLLEKDREMGAERILLENLGQKETAKWQRMVQSLKEQLRASQDNRRNVAVRQQDNAEERLALKEQNETLQYQVEDLNTKVKFLQELLEEAKGAFIDAQLRQQDSLERKEREKREYCKRNQLLKTQIKSLKGHPHTPHTPSTLSHPSNQSTRTSSTVSLTPFRTIPPSRNNNSDLLSL